jgi:hypothetical protein
MPDLPSAPPPTFISKRDGSHVPFEPDKICRALFAATETLGRPDAFLAREMTDGVVHFLSAELGTAVPSTAQVADTVAKVVRELGQPALAHAFLAGANRKIAKRGASFVDEPETVIRVGPATDLPTLLRSCARNYSVRKVFARDLVAAQAAGLLTLTGLESPLELAGCTADPLGGSGWMQALIDAREIAGALAAVDGPEYFLAETANKGGMAQLARELKLGHRAAKLGIIANLNVSQPPAWAGNLAAGPLFPEQRTPDDSRRLTGLADTLLECLFSHAQGMSKRESGPGGAVGLVDPGEQRSEARSMFAPHSPFYPAPLRVDWHLCEQDFEPGNRDRLLRVVRHALRGVPVTFVFDRPRADISLAEGMDRRNPAVLMVVGVHLPRLLEQPGVQQDPLLFLQKVGSLGRMALSAGVQKRDFLRRNTEGRLALTRGFLLERARLVVVPIGLESVVRTLVGEGLGGRGIDLGRRIVERLADVLERDGAACRLPARLDSPPGPLESIAADLGVTPWDATSPIRSQLKAASELHAAAKGGTAVVHLPTDESPSAEGIADWLAWAWGHTSVNRLRWFGRASAECQPLLGLEEDHTS